MLTNVHPDASILLLVGPIAVMSTASFSRNLGYGLDMINVDATDLRIIGALRENGRRSIVDISQDLGIPRSTVKRRLDALIDQGVLMITPYVDSAKLGLAIHVHLNIRLAPERYSVAIQAIAELTEIRWVAVTTGPYDVVAEGFFASPDHLHEFIRDRFSIIDGIRSVETSVILSLEKFDFHWDEIRAMADLYPPSHIPLGGGNHRKQVTERVHNVPDSHSEGDREPR